MKIETNCEQETIDVAIEFAKSLGPQSMVLLKGELGAGKTCFVRGLCEGLGGEPRQVSSPTFTIVQEYEIDGDWRLVHIDCYRLSGEEELETIGWDELCEDPSAIIAVEWPDRIQGSLPTNATWISIEHLAESRRLLEIK